MACWRKCPGISGHSKQKYRDDPPIVADHRGILLGLAFGVTNRHADHVITVVVFFESVIHEHIEVNIGIPAAGGKALIIPGSRQRQRYGQ
jgi:hypothetical protein